MLFNYKIYLNKNKKQCYTGCLIADGKRVNKILIVLEFLTKACC